MSAARPWEVIYRRRNGTLTRRGCRGPEHAHAVARGVSTTAVTDGAVVLRSGRLVAAYYHGVQTDHRHERIPT